ncbi:F510_1955 family glycosylhydrolase [Aquipuribacter sp. MA13-6]|uniref:F510_1955 family glycosylhydrolase n=1 Tax=unclassified Aquipuribacter TaxID=2635084 RepID=UPI003EECC703
MKRGRVSHASRALVPSLLGSVALLLAGCAGGQERADPAAGSTDPGMGHVHGLGVDPTSGDVLAAAHTGLFRLVDGEPPVRVADRWQDTMGFAVDGDRLLGSGHPDLREDLPAHLGLIESTDAGQTWTSVSLLGEADLHALTVGRSGSADVFGWDSVSGAVLSSGDGGLTWQHGESFEAVSDLGVAPDGTTLLATTVEGLLASTDRGISFAPFSPQPPVLLSQVETITGSTTGLAGVGVDGTVWQLVEKSWGRAGVLPAAPAAFAVTQEGSYLAATEQEVLRSDDEGRTWDRLALLSTGGGS